MLEELTNRLAGQLMSLPATSQVVIKRQGDGYLSQVPQQLQREANCETLANLKALFGQDRLKRIFLRPELALTWVDFETQKLLVTKEVIQKIWAAMGDVRKDDLEFALGKEVQGTSCEQIKQTFERLIPCKVALDIFSKVDEYDKNPTSGTGLRGLMERVWTILSGSRLSQEASERVSFAETEIFSSRLGDREPPVGTVAWFDTGYYATERIFSGGGAYVTLWRHLSEPSRYLLVCRGTAMRTTASQGFMSGLNCLNIEIGFLGIKTIWPELQKYLRENRVQTLDIVGKSLGGVHSQYLTALVVGLTQVRLQKVKTNCGVGAPRSVQTIYDRTIAQKKCPEPKVEIFRNDGDCIPYVGGPHLHTTNTTSIHYAVERGAAKQAHKGGWSACFELLRSFGLAHCRQMSLINYDLLQSRDIEEELNLGTRLEPLRQKVASLFNVVTLGWLNQETFEQFYLRQLAEL